MSNNHLPKCFRLNVHHEIIENRGKELPSQFVMCEVRSGQTEVYHRLLESFGWQYSHTTKIGNSWRNSRHRHEYYLRHCYKNRYHPYWSASYSEHIDTLEQPTKMEFGKCGSGLKHDCAGLRTICEYLARKTAEIERAWRKNNCEPLSRI